MRQYLSALAWIAVTTAVVAAAQIVTTKAAAERRAVTKLNIELVENTVRIRELEAELRTRAGWPELQRWNDAVFQLSAPQGAQILRSPLQLASFAARPDADAGNLPASGPSVLYAITEPGLPGEAAIPSRPPAAPATGARVVAASYKAGGGADTGRAILPAEPTEYSEAPPAPIAAPAAAPATPQDDGR